MKLISFSQPSASHDLRARQALACWGLFFILNILINGTIPFILGADLQSYTYSPIKDLLYNLLIYSGMFLVVPLLLTKGWTEVRQPPFLVPLLIAVAAMTARTAFKPVAALAVIALIYIHWRFDLSELGFRSSNWRVDFLAILLIGLLYLLPTLFQSASLVFTPIPALLAGFERLFTNPASTTENLFYFGFLAERLYYKTGRWITPLLIGFMYVLHEMSNPEYWYENVSFLMIFFGVALIASIYLWRRSIYVVWLGDGLGRFFSRLF